MIHQAGGFAMTLLKSMFSTVERGVSCVVAGLSSFFAPIEVAIYAVICFILWDAVQGYRVSRKYGYNKLESGKIWRTFRKLADAAILVGAAHVVDTYVVTSVYLHMVEITAGSICMTEFWSMLESYVEMNRSKTVAKLLLKIIKAKGEKYLDIKIDDSDLNNRGENEHNKQDSNADYVCPYRNMCVDVPPTDSEGQADSGCDK